MRSSVPIRTFCKVLHRLFFPPIWGENEHFRWGENNTMGGGIFPPFENGLGGESIFSPHYASTWRHYFPPILPFQNGGKIKNGGKIPPICLSPSIQMVVLNGGKMTKVLA